MTPSLAWPAHLTTLSRTAGGRLGTVYTCRPADAAPTSPRREASA